MPLRVLVILALLAQQLALPLAMRGARSSECEVTSCCVAVSMTTCCGEVVEEMRCGRTGGECRCAAESSDSEPSPATPRPQDRSDLAPIFAALTGGVIESPAPVRTRGRWTPPAIRRTHNETQALLCIWRT